MDSKLKEVIEKVRNELQEIVDREMNNLLHRFDYGGPVEQLDVILPLSAMPSYFKGKNRCPSFIPMGQK